MYIDYFMTFIDFLVIVVIVAFAIHYRRRPTGNLALIINIPFPLHPKIAGLYVYKSLSSSSICLSLSLFFLLPFSVYLIIIINHVV